MTPAEYLVCLDPIISTDNHGRTYRVRDVLDADGWDTLLKIEEVQRLLRKIEVHRG